MRNRPAGPRPWAGVCRTLGALLVSALLCACQSPYSALQQLAQQHGRHLETVPGQPFPLVLLAPEQPASKRLRVYLEGDGHAWATPSQPSLDPSPRNLLVARLAINDPTPNAYLARPCQFVTAAGCTTALWTDRRFAQEVVTSLSQALDRLKQRFGNREFELVGYSGGAALAVLLAGQRDDVTQLQTIAGNLDPGLWVRRKGLSPLDGSLDPMVYRTRLKSLPQRHLLGGRDTVITGDIAASFRGTEESSRCNQRIIIPAASHEQGWENAWAHWQSQLIGPCP
ncbi:alpha/beta hydrolase [Pseudomonas rubra]|uniref:Alpha/beta hydrolase n=1 Tax=Pseudomonas rubra TaxID=2942627 RepID=A0ABT5PFV3_9PSED|nr:alpha/beta hydrolase [Pseudomonas rubra]MDD1017076.1 alpha/beta hydrolase [Pseudomonas rubra]MDD1036643.1 alpha/beta hydrolase [Pseudomonas rubra]MDD1156005.1 alpha/beta hydrolase [Pseudomonas rubra]